MTTDKHKAVKLTNRNVRPCLGFNLLLVDIVRVTKLNTYLLTYKQLATVTYL